MEKERELTEKEAQAVMGVNVLEPGSLITQDMAEMMAADAGQGFEQVSIKDVAMPFIAILQSLSPQVKKGSTAKIDGAEEGFIFHTVKQTFVDPTKTHIRIVNCGFQKRWVEWKPDRGGFVSTHKTDQVLLKCTKDEKGKYKNSAGNYIVETAYHFVLLVADDGSYEQAVISMASTQLKNSRRLISLLMSLKLDFGGKKVDAPMFSHTFDVNTKIETKGENSWFGWDLTHPTLITDPALYTAARKFHEMVKDGLDLTPPADDMVEATDVSSVTDY
jgi:hypothetical protein